MVYQSCLSIQGTKPLNILDVGAASGAGTNLTRNFLNNLLGVESKVTALDLEGRFQSYAMNRFPEVDYLIQDVFSLQDNSYDLFIVSHTLEHIPNPFDFTEKLRSKNDGALQIYYVPWKEESLIPGHLTTFNENSLNKVKGLIYARVLRSIGWRTTQDSMVLIFVTAGKRLIQDENLISNLVTAIDGEFSTIRF